MTSRSPWALTKHCSLHWSKKKHLEKNILNLLLILGQRKATTDAGLIQRASYVSDVAIVRDGRRVTFTWLIVTVYPRDRRHNHCRGSFCDPVPACRLFVSAATTNFGMIPREAALQRDRSAAGGEEASGTTTSSFCTEFVFDKMASGGSQEHGGRFAFSSSHGFLKVEQVCLTFCTARLPSTKRCSSPRARSRVHVLLSQSCTGACVQRRNHSYFNRTDLEIGL